MSADPAPVPPPLPASEGDEEGQTWDWQTQTDAPPPPPAPPPDVYVLVGEELLQRASLMTEECTAILAFFMHFPAPVPPSAPVRAVPSAEEEEEEEETLDQQTHTDTPSPSPAPPARVQLLVEEELRQRALLTTEEQAMILALVMPFRAPERPLAPSVRREVLVKQEKEDLTPPPPSPPSPSHVHLLVEEAQQRVALLTEESAAVLALHVRFARPVLPPSYISRVVERELQERVSLMSEESATILAVSVRFPAPVPPPAPAPPADVESETDTVATRDTPAPSTLRLLPLGGGCVVVQWEPVPGDVLGYLVEVLVRSVARGWMQRTEYVKSGATELHLWGIAGLELRCTVRALGRQGGYGAAASAVCLPGDSGLPSPSDPGTAGTPHRAALAVVVRSCWAAVIFFLLLCSVLLYRAPLQADPPALNCSAPAHTTTPSAHPTQTLTPTLSERPPLPTSSLTNASVPGTSNMTASTTCTAVRGSTASLTPRHSEVRRAATVTPTGSTTASSLIPPLSTPTPWLIGTATCTGATATATRTRTPTPSPTGTSTSTPLPTRSPTHTPTPTVVPTTTAVPTQTGTPTSTDTPVPTATPSPTPTSTPTPTPTWTSTPSSTRTPTATPTPTLIPTRTSTGTCTPTPAPTSTPLPTHTATPTAAATSTSTSTSTQTPPSAHAPPPAPLHALDCVFAMTLQLLMLLLVAMPLVINGVITVAFHATKSTSVAGFRTWVRSHCALSVSIYAQALFAIDSLSTFHALVPALGHLQTPPNNEMPRAGAAWLLACGSACLCCWSRCCCARPRTLITTAFKLTGPDWLQTALQGLELDRLCLQPRHVKALYCAIKSDAWPPALCLLLCAAGHATPEQLRAWLEADDPGAALRDALAARLGAVQSLCLNRVLPHVAAYRDLTGADAHAARRVADAVRGLCSLPELLGALQRPADFLQGVADRAPQAVLDALKELVEPALPSLLAEPGWAAGDATSAVWRRCEAQCAAWQEPQWLQLCHLLATAPAHAAVAGLLCAGDVLPWPLLPLWLAAEDPRRAVREAGLPHWAALRERLRPWEPLPGAPALQDLEAVMGDVPSAPASPVCMPTTPVTAPGTPPLPGAVAGTWAPPGGDRGPQRPPRRQLLSLFRPGAYAALHSPRQSLQPPSSGSPPLSDGPADSVEPHDCCPVCHTDGGAAACAHLLRTLHAPSPLAGLAGALLYQHLPWLWVAFQQVDWLQLRRDALAMPAPDQYHVLTFAAVVAFAALHALRLFWAVARRCRASDPGDGLRPPSPASAGPARRPIGAPPHAVGLLVSVVSPTEALLVWRSSARCRNFWVTLQPQSADAAGPGVPHLGCRVEVVPYHALNALRWYALPLPGCAPGISYSVVIQGDGGEQLKPQAYTFEFPHRDAALPPRDAVMLPDIPGMQIPRCVTPTTTDCEVMPLGERGTFGAGRPTLALVPRAPAGPSRPLGSPSATAANPLVRSKGKGQTGLDPD